MATSVPPRPSFQVPNETVRPNTSIKVTTTQRYEIPTMVMTTEGDENDHNIRLTLTDVHLKDEQLPFCYFFEETLDEDQLKASLEQVLLHFPLLGGSISKDGLSIECRQRIDFVPLSFGTINRTLQGWLYKTKKNGNTNKPKSRDHTYRTAKHPTLLPLFDSLFGEQREDGSKKYNDDSTTNNNNQNNLASIRVTYFQGGGTAIGVNMSHILGDTASCVRFVQCWGKEMLGKTYPKGTCQQGRQNATTSVMMTEELVEIMNYGRTSDRQEDSSTLSDDRLFGNMLSSFTEILSISSLPLLEKAGDIPDETPLEKDIDHEYVRLAFPPEVLIAMKAHGMMACSTSRQAGDDDDDDDDSNNCSNFVSTNDLITSFGWLIKRAISGNEHWDLSVVVNIRGRFGIDDFSCMKKKSIIKTGKRMKGVFGNGITNVIAKYQPTFSTFGIDDISQAAISIRQALHHGITIDIPDQIAQLQHSGGLSSPQSSFDSFSTTSWSQFPVWNIQFTSGHKLVDFHGHPAHPLPRGETFASVIMTTADGGCIYKLLSPKEKADDVKCIHNLICASYLEWYNTHRTSVADD